MEPRAGRRAAGGGLLLVERIEEQHAQIDRSVPSLRKVRIGRVSRIEVGGGVVRRYIGYASDGSYADPRTLIVDVRSFPGNSGSPIFQEAGFAGSRLLLGMITSGDGSLDAALAEPASRVTETIEHARKTNLSRGVRWQRDSRR